MLIIRCAVCKQKLWRYNKIGKGQVLLCHKDRITHFYACEIENDSIACPCGNRIGIDMGLSIKMIRKAFTCSGTRSK
ncbi:hypothetical protein JXQ70_13965 [bacterium]|nr:hypothetical protein [bacterium]